MENLIHADIFFFISSIGFILVGGLATIALIHLIRILRAVSRLTSALERGVDSLGDEAKEFIADIRHSRMYSMFFGRSPRRKK